MGGSRARFLTTGSRRTCIGTHSKPERSPDGDRAGPAVQRNQPAHIDAPAPDASHPERQLGRADNYLARVGQDPWRVLDINADRPAVRSEPEHQAHRGIRYAVREVLQLVGLARVAAITNVERGATALATTSDNQKWQ
jgi:hypothetical protein